MNGEIILNDVNIDSNITHNKQFKIEPKISDE